MLAAPEIGLPYGSIPRLVFAWLTTEAARTRKFKEKFVHHLRAVHTVYGEARFDIAPTGLELQPSKPHVPRIK